MPRTRSDTARTTSVGLNMDDDSFLEEYELEDLEEEEGKEETIAGLPPPIPKDAFLTELSLVVAPITIYDLQLPTVDIMKLTKETESFTFNFIGEVAKIGSITLKFKATTPAYNALNFLNMKKDSFSSPIAVTYPNGTEDLLDQLKAHMGRVKQRLVQRIEAKRELSVYVTNVPSDTTEAMLKSVFPMCHEVLVQQSLLKSNRALLRFTSSEEVQNFLKQNTDVWINDNKVELVHAKSTTNYKKIEEPKKLTLKQQQYKAFVEECTKEDGLSPDKQQGGQKQGKKNQQQRGNQGRGGTSGRGGPSKSRWSGGHDDVRRSDERRNSHRDRDTHSRHSRDRGLSPRKSAGSDRRRSSRDRDSSPHRRDSRRGDHRSHSRDRSRSSHRGDRGHDKESRGRHERERENRHGGEKRRSEDDKVSKLVDNPANLDMEPEQMMELLQAAITALQDNADDETPKTERKRKSRFDKPSNTDRSIRPPWDSQNLATSYHGQLDPAKEHVTSYDSLNVPPYTVAKDLYNQAPAGAQYENRFTNMTGSSQLHSQTDIPGGGLQVPNSGSVMDSGNLSVSRNSIGQLPVSTTYSSGIQTQQPYPFSGSIPPGSQTSQVQQLGSTYQGTAAQPGHNLVTYPLPQTPRYPTPPTGAWGSGFVSPPQTQNWGQGVGGPGRDRNF